MRPNAAESIHAHPAYLLGAGAELSDWFKRVADIVTEAPGADFGAYPVGPGAAAVSFAGPHKTCSIIPTFSAAQVNIKSMHLCVLSSHSFLLFEPVESCQQCLKWSLQHDGPMLHELATRKHEVLKERAYGTGKHTERTKGRLISLR